LSTVDFSKLTTTLNFKCDRGFVIGAKMMPVHCVYSRVVCLWRRTTSGARGFHSYGFWTLNCFTCDKISEMADSRSVAKTWFRVWGAEIFCRPQIEKIGDSLWPLCQYFLNVKAVATERIWKWGHPSSARCRSYSSTFLALKVQLVVLVSAFVMVSTVWSVSCLLFF